MKKKKYVFNVDYLKICYIQPQNLWEYIAHFNLNDFIHYENFSLQVIDDGRNKNEENDKPRTKIVCNVLLDEGTKLGTFYFNNSNKMNGKCWFTFDNKTFYTSAGSSINGKYNYIGCLNWVEQVLNLRINNITQVDVSCDVNFNVIKKIMDYIKNSEDYTMYYNGNIIHDNTRKIKNFGEYFSRSRAKRERYPSLYMGQKNDDAISIKVYNKLQEIKEESGKTYIQEWNVMSNTMYRVECSLKNDDIKKFLDVAGQSLYEWGNLESFTTLLGMEQYLHLLWLYTTDRVLYFRSKGGNKEVINLNDLCTG